MTKLRVLQLIESSLASWDSVSNDKIKDIDAIIDQLTLDGLDYENITYLLLNIMLN